jgi:hypothetical protein
MLPQAAGVGVKAATSVAKAITGGGDDVARAALENRALPGMLRSGASRAESRIESAAGDARKALGKSTTTIQPVIPPNTRASTGRNMTEALASAERQLDNVDRRVARREAGRITYNLASKPRTPSELFEMSEGSRMKALGSESPDNAVRRAAGADTRLRLANVVPEASPALKRISDVAPVLESYRKAPKNPVDPTGLPNLTWRLAAATLNRALGPVTQGAYNVSRMGQSDISRLALMSMLEQSMRER